MITPKENRSALVSHGSPISNSGAAYAKVPAAYMHCEQCALEKHTAAKWFVQKPAEQPPEYQLSCLGRQNHNPQYH